MIRLDILARDDHYDAVKAVLSRYGLEVPSREHLRREGCFRVPVEKTDPRLERIMEDLRGVGLRPFPVHAPAFEPWELEQAELVRLRIEGFCGPGFAEWAEELGLPPGTLVMDKRKMGKQDIARTFRGNEFVISERVREILDTEGLTGWVAEPILHCAPTQDRFPPLYRFTASHVLPPLAPETELELRTYDNPNDPSLPMQAMVHLYGTTELLERGPLTYRRKDLGQVADVNRTHEVFLAVTTAHPYFIMSQRTRQAFVRHRVRGDIEWEPVVILE